MNRLIFFIEPMLITDPSSRGLQLLAEDLQALLQGVHALAHLCAQLQGGWEIASVIQLIQQVMMSTGY